MATPSSEHLRRLLPRGVSYYGPLDQLSHDDFSEILTRHGGRYVRYARHAPFALLVLGEGDLPLTPAGDLIDFGRRAVMAEGAFLAALGERAEAAEADQSFTLPALSDLLKVPQPRLLAWAKAGLLRPRASDHGVLRFDLRHAATARTLVGLTDAGVGAARLRRSIKKLGPWLPDLDEPRRQLAVLERAGPLLSQLESGDPRDAGGASEPRADSHGPQSFPLFGGFVPRLRTAADWHEQGVSQEQAGLLAEAADSYRQALLAGGPDAQVCFDLAHVLAELGRKEQASERYRQVTEIDPRRADAWNNLGVLLADLGDAAAAVDAFRRAVRIDPLDADAQYNLADALDDAGAGRESAEQFRRYLRMRPFPSAHAEHARQHAVGGS